MSSSPSFRALRGKEHGAKQGIGILMIEWEGGLGLELRKRFGGEDGFLSTGHSSVNVNTGDPLTECSVNVRPIASR